MIRVGSISVVEMRLWLAGLCLNVPIEEMRHWLMDDGIKVDVVASKEETTLRFLCLKEVVERSGDSLGDWWVYALNNSGRKSEGEKPPKNRKTKEADEASHVAYLEEMDRLRGDA
jgi:hypothetical protein